MQYKEAEALAGMRPILNLGKSSRVVFKAGHARQCRPMRAPHTVLSFRPVNSHLQQLHRVCTSPPQAALPCCA